MLVRGFRAGLNHPRRKPAGHAADRNKCTLQVLTLRRVFGRATERLAEARCRLGKPVR
jgi:hypothetical protein